jgi:hypothetical protein
MGDAVFESSGVGFDEEPTRVGTLSRFLTTLVGEMPSTSGPGGNLLGEARLYVHSMLEYRFVVSELIPLLRSLRPGPKLGAGGPAAVARKVGSLERRANDLRHRLESARSVLAREPAEVLARWVGGPCALVPRAVIPLEPVARPGPSSFYTTIEGAHYRFALERTIPLSTFLSTIRRTAQVHAHRALRGDAALSRMVSRFVRDARSLLDRLGAEDRGTYLVLDGDPDHHLQHSHGSWVLVRGPVQNRLGGGSVYVGLEIKGSGRAQWLSPRPRASRTGQDFWVSPGEARQGGFCMGSDSQYRHLLRQSFSDGEAVIQWLDAGVIVATRRSEFHRSWRKSRGEDLYICSRARGRQR